jgi:hypothetical protein
VYDSAAVWLTTLPLTTAQRTAMLYVPAGLVMKPVSGIEMW